MFGFDLWIEANLLLRLEACVVDMLHVWFNDYGALKLCKRLLVVYNCIVL